MNTKQLSSNWFSRLSALTALVSIGQAGLLYSQTADGLNPGANYTVYTTASSRTERSW
jgi:hypothetical protein